jgi:hypothetical protein
MGQHFEIRKIFSLILSFLTKKKLFSEEPPYGIVRFACGDLRDESAMGHRS